MFNAELRSRTTGLPVPLSLRTAAASELHSEGQGGSRPGGYGDSTHFVWSAAPECPLDLNGPASRAGHVSRPSGSASSIATMLSQFCQATADARHPATAEHADPPRMDRTNHANECCVAQFST